ncbi:MAG TPA: YggS family pyridoxal phosphate-dependent enzyme [Aeromicrobium sp.]|nr:YggS family pyridoxal phosphate-dependent enzyme [Aeromicrobium sp.]HKY57686.1 YggS family pyridoxal phosphate-dependent enzyme [Aeromicrobium sp.]
MNRIEQLRANLAAVEARISGSCAAAGRSRGEVTLIVVTKTYPASDVDLLVELGVTDIGENRHPEAGRKLADLRGPAPRMHFIGSLQTNKANAVARYADVVQSVDRPRLAEALSRGAALAGRELGCLVQVDFGDSGLGRAGVAPAEADALADLVAASPGLRLDGVMTVAPLGEDPRRSFEALAHISADLRRRHPAATVVSAGMSEDFELAIQSGATHLRVGRLILGERVPLR